jgi:mannose-6-phosphate isomerase-like protein (cupin superfamily)
MGVAVIEPGRSVPEHYHPYSEEFLYVVAGTLTVDLAGEPVLVRADEGMLVPVATWHRLRNMGTEPVRVVCHHGPLPPRPDLDRVDTETATEAAEFTALAAVVP